MAKRNVSKYAILGLLSWKPMSGYDMKQYVEQGIRFFWNMSYGTIYPMLKKLEAEKLVTKEVQVQQGKPDRIIYSITEEGRAVLIDWQLSSTELAQLYDELLLKLFVGQNLSVDDQISIIQSYREKMEARHLLFRESEPVLLEASAKSKQDLMFYLTLKSGVYSTEAKLRWCDDCIAILKNVRSESGNKEKQS